MRRELTDAPEHPQLERLRETIDPVRREIIDHSLYEAIEDPADLRVFMKYHVFAVWDFMSLLTALQRAVTCVSVPWVPQGDTLARRLVNDIVLEEESDETPEGSFSSHFEIYREAMERAGADTKGIDQLLNAIRSGASLSNALARPAVPDAARSFVRVTDEVIRTGDTHRIAAAFTFGREGLIPQMFAAHVRKLSRETPDDSLELYRYYLNRHIELDDEEHGPMALRMIVQICGDDASRWRDAAEVAEWALEARKRLWDAIEREISS